VLDKLLIQSTDFDTLPRSELLATFMEESAARHHHLCPRQVLGIRMALYGLRMMGMVDDQYQPRYYNERKELLTVVETDGCGADGIAVATSCYVGRRTLRVLDFGKMAATLVHTGSGKAVRVVPRPDSRKLAYTYAPDAQSRWHAYLKGYQVIPDALFLVVKEVILTQSIAEILSKPSARVNCDSCGEEILNEREIRMDGRTLCRPCTGVTYYREL